MTTKKQIDLRTITASDAEQRELEAMRPRSPHLHDLAFTISAGDLEPEQLKAMRRILRDEVEALVERVNAETVALTGQKVYGYLSYDGKPRAWLQCLTS